MTVPMVVTVSPCVQQNDAETVPNKLEAWPLRLYQMNAYSSHLLADTIRRSRRAPQQDELFLQVEVQSSSPLLPER